MVSELLTIIELNLKELIVPYFAVIGVICK